MTRIISGKYKGRRIAAPKKLPVRPTTDMAKEALFNIIRSRFHISTLEVLDLFAGTGNISYEFSSRGALKVTAVDSHYGCVRFIQETAEQFELEISATKSDVFAYLQRTKATYDIIFADPPYDIPLEQFKKIVTTVFENQLLAPEGLLIVEHSKHTDLSDSTYFTDSRHYGGNAFSFFELPETDEEE